MSGNSKESLSVLDSASGSEMFTSRGDISGQWSFSTRSTLTYPDVSPRVYLFLKCQDAQKFTPP